MLLILALIFALIILPWPWSFAVIVIAAACEVSVAVLGICYTRRRQTRVGVETLIGTTCGGHSFGLRF